MQRHRGVMSGSGIPSRRMVLRGALPLLAAGVSSVACAKAGPEGSDEAPEFLAATANYVADVGAAVEDLINLTPESQRPALLYPFDSQARTLGRDTSQTESFCAVLQWCPIGWGVPIVDMDVHQRTALHALLERALSAGGYQTLLAILNRNRIVGEMEDVGDATVVDHVRRADPAAAGAESIFEFSGLEPDSPAPWYPVVGGAKTFSATGTTVEWSWDPPGLKERYHQFGDYTIAIFGRPGDDGWALRFEGHHISINLTMQKDKDGTYAVNATPLFLGAVPIVVPVDPYAPEDISTQWHWTSGQVMMLGVVHHLREFWRNVPDDVRRGAFIGANLFEQAPPLVLDTPPSSLVAGLSAVVNQRAIDAYPHVTIDARGLSEKALWNLRQAFACYTGAMNPNVGPGYLSRFDQAVRDGKTLTLSWAGGSLEELGTHHYTYAVVDDLLLEVLQSNQYSVQQDRKFVGNHLHTMLRDLKFDWDDPMARHHQHDHTTTHG